MKQEFKRGYDITETIIREKGSQGWHRLFEPSDFFVKYSHYLSCHIVGGENNSESRGWIGFVESRLRRFIPLMESLPVKMPIQLYPVTCKTQKSSYSVCYFIGFNFDLDIVKNLPNKDIHIDECVYRFQYVFCLLSSLFVCCHPRILFTNSQSFVVFYALYYFDLIIIVSLLCTRVRENLFDPDRGYRGTHFEGMDFFVEHIPWKKLPKEVFEPIGGRDVAKLMRQSTYGLLHNSGRKRRDSLSSPLPTSSEIVSNGMTSGAMIMMISFCFVCLLLCE